MDWKEWVPIWTIPTKAILVIHNWSVWQHATVLMGHIWQTYRHNLKSWPTHSVCVCVWGGVSMQLKRNRIWSANNYSDGNTALRAVETEFVEG